MNRIPAMTLCALVALTGCPSKSSDTGDSNGFTVITTGVTATGPGTGGGGGTGTGTATGAGTGTGAATGTGTGTGGGTGSGTGMTYPTGVEGCANGIDDTGDGLIDCGDPLCIGDPACPTAGDLVVAELLINPFYLSDEDGEWFEIHNPTATSFDLIGCEIVDDQGPIEVSFTSNMPVPAGGSATVARGPAPGFAATYTDAGVSLGGGDGFSIVCAGEIIDTVAWNGTDFPVVFGASMQLDPGALDATSNDYGSNWCQTNEADPGYTGGPFGNPGVGNPACPVAGPEVCDDGIDNDLDGTADCGDDDCAGDPACPGAGDVVITEILNDAVALPDDQGDWFELYNPTGSDWNLSGCISEDDNGFGTEVFFPSVVIPAGGTLTVAAGPSPGFTPDVVAQNLSLADNATDGFTILCGGVALDTVIWDAFSFPTPSGQSFQLDPGFLDATSNDDGANWCQTNAADPGFTSGDQGNPGVLNPPCPVAAPEVCDDAIDNDLDGDTDCADADCTADPVCQETCSGGVDEDLDGLVDCGDDDCAGDPVCPAAGDIVITEMLIDTAALPEDEGQYIELHNPTGTDFDLWGCGVYDDQGGLDQRITGSFPILAGGVVTIARSANPGFAQDGVAAGMNLAFGFPDGVYLDCGGVVLDTVDYDDTWPFAEAFSMQLDPASLDATSNDDPANWCTTNAADPGFTSGDYGNPGVLNPPCPVSSAEVCTDGIDNDLDQLVDCLDDDCVLDMACAENCINGLDDNGTGQIDCADASCAGSDHCPVPGAVIVSEVMTDPLALPDEQGDWFELYNTTADPITLQGCQTIDDGGFLEADFPGLLVIDAGDVVTVSRGNAPGFTPDLVDGNMNMFEGGTDGFSLICQGQTIDTILWDGSFPAPVGGSFQLDSGFFNEVDNDDGANWCAAQGPDPAFTSGDRGSPGVVNGPCPAAVAEVCGDGLDNDLDGLADCRDSDCSADPSCLLTLTDCDPTYCTFSAATGPNGGDECTCIIPAADHPQADNVEGSCFGGYFGSPPSVEMLWTYDLGGNGYTEYVVDTCSATVGDSALVAYDGDPLAAGAEVECVEDTDFFSGCANIEQPFIGGPVAAPGSGTVVVAVDEAAPGDYWDGVTDREITIELVP